MSDMEKDDMISIAITEAFGERCQDFSEGCPACETWKQYDNVVNTLKWIRDFPKEGYGRRTDDGYPDEICYDEWAYRRMVDGYRESANAGLFHHQDHISITVIEGINEGEETS